MTGIADDVWHLVFVVYGGHVLDLPILRIVHCAGRPSPARALKHVLLSGQIADGVWQSVFVVSGGHALDHQSCEMSIAQDCLLQPAL